MKKTFSKIIKIISISIIIATIATIFGCINANAYIVWEEIDCEGKYKVAYTQELPTLDGEAEKMWDDAYEIEITDVVENKEGASAATGKLRLLWGNDYIFLYCEITDENVCSSESVDKNNDCLEFEFGRNLSQTEDRNPEDAMYDFLIYSEYKEEYYGPTINNNLRDYVMAEYKKTDKGYNVEAYIRIPKNVLKGDEFDITATIYNIEKENGEAVSKTEIEKGKYTTAIFVDEKAKTKDNDSVISFITIDLENEYTQEDIVRMEKLYDPAAIILLNAENYDTSFITESDYRYVTKQHDGSAVKFVYSYEKLKFQQTGTLGQDVDCSYGYFTTVNDGTSFYIVAAELEEKYAAVRRTQLVSVLSDMKTINRYEFPVICCMDLNAPRNSYTYTALEGNEYKNCEYMSDEYVKREDDNTLFNFVTYKKIDKINYCRYDDEAVVISISLSGTISVEKIQRKNIFYIAEGIVTVLAAGGICYFLLKKSKKKVK